MSAGRKNLAEQVARAYCVAFDEAEGRRQMNRWKLLVGRVCRWVLIAAGVAVFGCMTWGMSFVSGHWWGGVVLAGGAALIFGIVFAAEVWRED